MRMKDDYDVIIMDAVAEHLPPGYDWRLFKAQCWQESRLIPDAVSPAGAVGICQIMPDTWDEWGPKAGFDLDVVDRTDPDANIYTAAMYLAWLIDEWSWPRPEIDRYCLAIASYNAGLGHMLEAQREQGSPSLYREIIVGLPDVTGHDNSNETIMYVSVILDFCNRQILGTI